MILQLRQNKEMLILKTHVHVDGDDWSSVDNKITLNVTCTFKSVHKFLKTPITRICPRILSNGLNESCLKTLESHDITE